VGEQTSLRDYQRGLSARLADLSNLRLVSKLGIEVGGNRWLVDLTDAGEVIPVPAIAPVPLTKPWYTGVANVRGNLYSIIDFSMFIGAAPAIRSERSRLVLISDKYRVGCALLIDAIVGLRSPHLFDRVTDTADAAQWIKARYTDREKNVWNELAVAPLIQDAGFLDIGVSLRQS